MVPRYWALANSYLTSEGDRRISVANRALKRFLHNFALLFEHDELRNGTAVAATDQDHPGVALAKAASSSHPRRRHELLESASELRCG